MYRRTSRLTHGHQAGDHAVGVVFGGAEDLTIIIRGDTAHVVVHGGQYGDRFFGDIHTGKNLGRFGDARQTFGQCFFWQVVEVQVDVIAIRAHTAPFADFHGHAAADVVTRGEVFVVGRIAFHEPFAFGVGEVSALTPCAFGDQTARPVDARGVELHEFHVLQRQPSAGHHAAAVARTGVRGCGGEIGAAIAARGQHNHFGVEDMHRAIVEFPADDTGTDAIIGHDQVDGEIFDVEFGLLFQRLTIKRVQDRVAGAVGGGTGALHGGAFAKFGRVTTKGALVNLAFFGARKRHAVMFQLVHRLGRFAGEVFHRVRIAQPVRPFHGVVHVPLPAVGSHVAQGRRDAALCCDRVGPCREHFGDTCRAQALFGHAQRGPQTGATSTHNHDIIFVGFIFVFSHCSDLEILKVQSARLRKRQQPPQRS